MLDNSHRTYSKCIGNDTRNHDVGNSKRILNAVFFARFKVDDLNPIPHQISNLANGKRWYKTSRNQAMFVQITKPNRILFIGFLAANAFYIFWVSHDNFTIVLQNIKYRMPILSSGFHTDMFAGLGFEPFEKTFQIFGKG